MSPMPPDRLVVPAAHTFTLRRLLVAHGSSLGTDADYEVMVTTLGPDFVSGFLAWGDAVAAAGWGRSGRQGGWSIATRIWRRWGGWDSVIRWRSGWWTLSAMVKSLDGERSGSILRRTVIGCRASGWLIFLNLLTS